MPRGDNMVLKGKVTAFRIWRAASSVNWDCTAKDLAEELNIDKNVVWKTCKAKGWKLATDRLGAPTDETTLAIDHYIKRVRRRQA